MVVYFSGTGNSRYVAERIASELGDAIVDATPVLKRREKLTLQSSAPYVFVCPTYAWKIPRIFRKLILRSEFGGSREAYFVMTCGNDIGAPEASLKKLCLAIKLEWKGVAEIVMPENYIAMFEVPDAQLSAEILERAKPEIKALIERVRAGEALPPRITGIADGIKSGLVNFLFYPFCVHAHSFGVTDTCVGCRKCVSLCPMNNIHIENGRPVWGHHCTHCMACISACPTEAIEYGRKSIGKPRYQCPHYCANADAEAQK